MRETRKLQFAKELIEEVSEEVDEPDTALQLRQLSKRVDDMRPELFNQELEQAVAADD